MSSATMTGHGLGRAFLPACALNRVAPPCAGLLGLRTGALRMASRGRTLAVQCRIEAGASSARAISHRR